MVPAILFVLAIFAPLTAQQPSPALPIRDNTTVQDLKEQIADCSINSVNESKYEAKLIARIRELEKELAEAKTPKP